MILSSSLYSPRCVSGWLELDRAERFLVTGSSDLRRPGAKRWDRLLLPSRAIFILSRIKYQGENSYLV